MKHRYYLWLLFIIPTELSICNEVVCPQCPNTLLPGPLQNKLADPESMLHIDRRKRELTTGWFLKLLPRSDTRSFLFTFPTLKQDTWATLEFTKEGWKINLFQRDLYFICTEVDSL